MSMSFYLSWLGLFVLFQGVKSGAWTRSRGLGDFGGDVGQYMSLLDSSSAMNFKPGASGKRDDTKNSRGFGESLNLRSFPGMGDGMFPGFGKRSLGAKGKGIGMNIRRKTLRSPPGTLTDERSLDASVYPSQNKSDIEANQRIKTKESKYRESGMGDFGGGFGKYMKMLEGDQISENQDLQSDVFGGGMSGKYWDMYKGSMGGGGGDSEGIKDSNVDTDLMAYRQSLEEDQPEDAPNSERSTDDSKDTYIVALKSPKEKIISFFKDLKSSIKSKDKKRVNALLDTLDTRQLNKKEFLEVKKLRKLMIIDDEEINSHKVDTVDTKEMQDKFEAFIDEMVKNVPDPIKTKKGIPSSFKSLSMAGFSSMKATGKVKKTFGNRWRGTLSLPSLLITITSAPGPGVPFNGKVIGIFRDNHIHVTFRESSEGSLHVISVKTKSDHIKFIPKFDSSIPLNPWSKISMSGYLVSRIKKYIPNLVDKTFLKLTHIIERLEKEK